MNSINLRDIQMAMAIGTFVLGIICIGIGIYILVSSSRGRNLQTIATQTTELAQKGLAEDVAGLVGNASALLNAMNNMAHTSAGIGLLLNVLGLLLIGAAYWFVLQIH